MTQFLSLYRHMHRLTHLEKDPSGENLFSVVSTRYDPPFYSATVTIYSLGIWICYILSRQRMRKPMINLRGCADVHLCKTQVIFMFRKPRILFTLSRQFVFFFRYILLCIYKQFLSEAFSSKQRTKQHSVINYKVKRRFK